MSEAEQSWSFYDTRSNLQRGRLIVCAMALLRPDEPRWPMDDHAFARAVDSQTVKGNPIAQAIYRYDGPAGRSCHDFREMLSFALSSCLVDYLSPEYTHMLINVGGRTCRQLLRGVPEEQIEQAKALAQEFWEQVHGRPES